MWSKSKEVNRKHIQAIETRLQQILLQTEEYIMENTKKSQLGNTSVASYKCLWAFIECLKRFFGLQSSLGITNVNRSHNKPLELIETI